MKDKLQPIVDKSVGDDEERMMDLSELNPSQRIQYLERSIIFLKQQHSEVLRSLHEEIEGLKKENKGTVFHSLVIWLDICSLLISSLNQRSTL